MPKARGLRLQHAGSDAAAAAEAYASSGEHSPASEAAGSEQLSLEPATPPTARVAMPVAIAPAAALLTPRDEEPMLPRGSPGEGLALASSGDEAAGGSLSPSSSRRFRLATYLKSLRGRSSATRTSAAKVFGVPLEEAVMRSRLPDNLELPAVFRRCVAYIEMYGLDHEGLYRLPGQKSRVEKLQALFDASGDVDLQVLLPNHQGDDINVVASLLKKFLRDLPDPVLTELLQPDFVAASCIEHELERTSAFRALLRQLPLPNYLLLGWLTRHLSHVAAHSAKNKMALSNLYIVFGPTVRIAQNILAHLLDYTDEMFPDVRLVMDHRAAANLLVLGGGGVSAAATNAPSPTGSHVGSHTASESTLPSAAAVAASAATAAAAAAEAVPLRRDASGSISSSNGLRRNTRLRMSRLLAPGTTEAEANAGGDTTTAAPTSSESEMKAELQRTLRLVTQLEKDVEARRQEVGARTTAGQDVPAEIMEQLLGTQRELTAAKRRVKELRRTLGVADVSVGASSRNALAASLNQLYCTLVLKNLELIAVGDKMVLDLKEEQAMRQSVETELRLLRTPAERPGSVSEQSPVVDRQPSTGSPRSPLALQPQQQPRETHPSTMPVSLTEEIENNPELADALRKLEQAKTELLAEQERLKAHIEASRAQLHFERTQCIERRIELNMLWLERHPAPLVENVGAVSSPSSSADAAPATPASTPHRPGTVTTPARLARVSANSASPGRAVVTPQEEENWAYAFHSRPWTYRTSESRVPLSLVMGPTNRLIASAEPPQRPAGLVELRPFKRRSVLVESSGAWEPLPRRQPSGSPVTPSTPQMQHHYFPLQQPPLSAIARSALLQGVPDTHRALRTGSFGSGFIPSPVSSGVPRTMGNSGNINTQHSPIAAFAFHDLHLESPSPLSSTDSDLEEDEVTDDDDDDDHAIAGREEEEEQETSDEEEETTTQRPLSGGKDTSPTAPRKQNQSVDSRRDSAAVAAAEEEGYDVVGELGSRRSSVTEGGDTASLGGGSNMMYLTDGEDDDVPAWKRELKRITPTELTGGPAGTWKVASTHDAPSHTLEDDDDVEEGFV